MTRAEAALREVDVGHHVLIDGTLVADDGRRMSVVAQLICSDWDIVLFLTGHLRIPAMPVVTAIEADEGEG